VCGAATGGGGSGVDVVEVGGVEQWSVRERSSNRWGRLRRESELSHGSNGNGWHTAGPTREWEAVVDESRSGIKLIWTTNSIQTWKIKYGCEGFDLRNNSPYFNFSKFRMDFELKFREASMSWIPLKILGTSEFVEIWLTSSSLHLVSIKINFKWFVLEIS
jgi:hypothetical protein